MNIPQNIRDICKKNNLTVTDHQFTLFGKYVVLLREWNEKINLLSRKDIENIWIRHIVGSLSLLFKNSFAENCTIADVGTGGGLPGIPLAIMLPGCRVTLIDSIRKKINAVEKMISDLSLSNAGVLHGRAEVLSRNPEHCNSYDYVIARAVGTVGEVVDWSSGFLKKNKRLSPVAAETGGKRLIPPDSIILMKGGDLSVEISRLISLKPYLKIETYPMVAEEIPAEDLQDKKFVIVSERKN